MMQDLTQLSASAAGALIASRRISPVELVDAFLARIEAVDQDVKSYILVLADEARAAAKQAEQEIMAGRWRGPLHGIPYGVKDNYFTKGVRTCAASRLLLDHVPAFSATTIEHLTTGATSMDFLEMTKLELFQDQVFCFTPKGRLIALPRGATPIDFAYALHTDIGDTTVGAKINGAIMPLVTQLRSGDEVEIIRDQNHLPPSN